MRTEINKFTDKQVNQFRKMLGLVGLNANEPSAHIMLILADLYISHKGDFTLNDADDIVAFIQEKYPPKQSVEEQVSEG